MVNGHSAQAPARRRHARFPHVNRLLISAYNTGDLNHLFSTISDYAEEMNLVNLATAWHRLAKLSGLHRAAGAKKKDLPEVPLNRLFAQTRLVLSRKLASPADFNRDTFQSFSNIAWGMGTLAPYNPPCVKVLVDCVNHAFYSFQPFELASVVWAFARLRVSTHPWSEDLKAAMGSIISRGSSVLCKAPGGLGFRFIIMVVWACVQTGVNVDLATGIYLPQLQRMWNVAVCSSADALIELLEVILLLGHSPSSSFFGCRALGRVAERSIREQKGWHTVDVIRLWGCLICAGWPVQETLKLWCLPQLADGEAGQLATNWMEVLRAALLPGAARQVGHGTLNQEVILPQLKEGAGDSLLAVANAAQLDPSSFRPEDLPLAVWILSQSDTCRQGLSDQSTLNYAQAGSRFLYDASATLSHHFGQYSGESVVQVVAAYTRSSMGGNPEVRRWLEEQVDRKWSSLAHPFQVLLKNELVMAGAPTFQDPLHANNTPSRPQQQQQQQQQQWQQQQWQQHQQHQQQQHQHRQQRQQPQQPQQQQQRQQWQQQQQQRQQLQQQQQQQQKQLHLQLQQRLEEQRQQQDMSPQSTTVSVCTPPPSTSSTTTETSSHSHDGSNSTSTSSTFIWCTRKNSFLHVQEVDGKLLSPALDFPKLPISLEELVILRSKYAAFGIW